MRETVAAQMKEAMKAGDKTRVGALRLIMAALKDREIEARGSSPPSMRIARSSSSTSPDGRAPNQTQGGEQHGNHLAVNRSAGRGMVLAGAIPRHARSIQLFDQTHADCGGDRRCAITDA